MKMTYKNFDELPLMLGAKEVADALNFSKSNAYCLMHREGFPTIYVGKRMLVPKDKFIDWLHGIGS